MTKKLVIGLSEDTRLVLNVLQNATESLTEREIKRASRKLKEVDIESVLQELIADGLVEKTYHSGGHRPTHRYEFIRCQTVAVDRTPENTGENGTSVNGNTVNTPKIGISTISEFDSFSDEQ